MKKIILVTLTFCLGLFSTTAQTTSCVDLNAYVDSKNVGGTGFYTLLNGFEEKASQTYHYSGPGKVSQVLVHGNFPGFGGVPLRIAIYNVDANGRPTSQISFMDDIFWWTDNAAGYITVSMPGSGTTVSNKFAVVISVLNAWPYGGTFQLKYTGNGEGLGADLASLAGTSTGGNWASAMTVFSNDGDFYLEPRMTNFITTGFTVSAQCAVTAASIAFTNTTVMTVDSMFNKIGLAGYSGTNYFYTWDFGDATPVSHAINPSHAYSSAGSYTVTLTTIIEGWGNTCYNVKTMNISVGLDVSPTSLVNVSCNGGVNGSIIASGSGGATPYMYSMDGITYQASASFTGLSSGSYALYIKDASGCIKSTTFSITQPSIIIFTTASSTNSSCGTSDGSILVTATGGSGAMQYKLNAGSYQSSGSFTGLVSGSYLLTAKDANNCTSSAFILVNDQGSPALTVTSTTNSSCYNVSDGTITLSATGGSGTLQYSINGGITYQTSGTFTGLPAAKYSVMVKDAVGCSQGLLVSITQPQVILFTASTVPTSCNGGNDGQINVTSAIGGIGTLIYSINGVSYQSNSSFSGLTAGNYTVYVKGSASCVSQANLFITQPAAVAATFVTVPATCNGSDDGSIVVNATGGTQVYTYSINNGTFQPSKDFNNLTAGVYSIKVKDSKNCQYSSNVAISQPSLVVAGTSSTNSTCGNNNGGILATASGGSGSGYLYSLDGVTFGSSGSFTSLTAGNYFVTIKDGTGCQNIVSETVFDSNGPSISSSSSTDVACNAGNDGTITVNTVSGGTGTLNYSLNGINWQTSTAFSGLYAGTYVLYVRDANSCIGTIPVTLTQPNAFTISNNLTNVTCNNGNSGSATILAGGGAGTLAYSINNGVTFQSSNTFSNLSAGTYTVMVRDIASCTGTTSFTITQPAAIISSIGVLNVSCNGSNDGTLTVYAFGGTGSLQYSMDGTNFQASNIFTGLSGGFKTVYMKDGNGCVSAQSVVVPEPAVLTLTTSASGVSCAGGNNGSINLTVTGGSGNYSYVWSNNSISEDISGLTAGPYSVSIVDGNGCSANGVYLITEPLQAIVVNAVINGTTTNSGSVDATITGGTMPYSYNWSNGATTQDISNIPSGFYTLTVIDANGCISTNQFIVPHVVGLEEMNVMESALVVYPNPTNESATVEMNGFVIESIKVLDVLGKLVYQNKPNSSKTEINTINFEDGLYIIEVIVDDIVINTKLQVIK